MTVYPFIEAEKVAERNVSRACELLKVSRSAYYEQRDAVPSARGAADALLAEQITKINEDSKGRYGAPRVHAALKRQGPPAQPQASRPCDEQAGPARESPEAVEEDHHRRPRRGGPAGPGRAELQRRCRQGEHVLVR